MAARPALSRVNLTREVVLPQPLRVIRWPSHRHKGWALRNPLEGARLPPLNGYRHHDQTAVRCCRASTVRVRHERETKVIRAVVDTSAEYTGHYQPHKPPCPRNHPTKPATILEYFKFSYVTKRDILRIAIAVVSGRAFDLKLLRILPLLQEAIGVREAP
jgi:hypothetical protein